jgi:hypothetical protein
METVGSPRLLTSSDELRRPVAEELDRILASEYFRNSKQAERLLRYLVAHSLEDHPDDLRERVVGEKVFGREPKYDSNSDSIVRVWANHLRKRLAQYYQSGNQTGSVRFDMRPGSYRVEFLPVVHEAKAPPEPAQATPAKPRNHRLLLLAGAAVLLAMACAWLAVQNFQLRSQLHEPKQPPPLNLLWSRLLAAKPPTEIVLADSNLSLLQDMQHKSISLQDYLRHSYTDPLMTRRYTSTADVELLRRTMLLAGPDAARLEVTFARDLQADDLKKKNVILIGSTRANPWLEPFASQMNFHFDYTIAGGAGVIVNTHPRAGEQPGYSVPSPMEETNESFGLLAFQPNLARTGNVLIIAGLGMQGTLAAGELATSPELFKQVAALLATNANGDLPYFEVVLKAGMMGSTVHGFKLMAWRTS